MTNVEFKILITAGGHIKCRQCAARSKRTGIQCRAPAMKEKTCCKAHGGKSTGPKTPEGRQRCAEAKTTHGQETRAIRANRQVAAERMHLLESLGNEIKLFTGPTTTPGRRPNATPENADLRLLLQAERRGTFKG